MSIGTSQIASATGMLCSMLPYLIIFRSQIRPHHIRVSHSAIILIISSVPL